MILILSGDIETNPGPFSLNFVNINVNGLRDKVDIITSQLNLFDLICITESHLNKEISCEKLVIPDFNPIIRRDRETPRGTPSWGGVSVYIKHFLPYTRRTDLELPDLEHIWIELHTSKKILLCTLYRPPSSPVALWETISRNIDHVLSRHPSHTVILTGDLNENLLSDRHNHLKNLMYEHSLYQLVTEATRPASNSLLDPVITNNPSMLQNCKPIAPICSDHTPVTFTVETSPFSKQTCFKRHIWLYDRADWNLFCENLAHYNWQNLINENDIDGSTKTLTNAILDSASTSIPNKTVTIRPNSNTWMNAHIKSVMRKRDKMYKVWSKNKTEINRTNFTRLRNQVVDLIRNAKREHLNKTQTKIELNKVGSKDWWKICKELLKGNRNFAHIPPLLNDDKHILDPKEKAELFNQYFASVSDLDDSHSQLPVLNKYTNSTLELLEFTEDEVLKTLKNLDVHKAVGPDKLSPRLLQEGRHIIVKPLTMLINKSLSTGKFPQAWKIASLTPIHKKSRKDLVSNYRPISLLSVMSKVMERLVCQKLHSYLSTLLVPNQSGFRPNHSTITQLLEIYQEIVKAIDEHKEIFFIFFDISKAFDRVWHQGLLFKLRQYGISGSLITWFESYLKNRSQKVTLQGAESSLREIRAGVPQGSVLGPLLFLIFINDLPLSIQSNIKMFADDTCLYIADPNLETKEITLNQDISNVSNWAKQWLVDFNPQKTVSLLVTKRQNPSHINMLMEDTPIIQLDMHKHLGVIINNKGTWTDHINNLLDSTLNKLNMLKSLKYILNRQSLEIMYKSFVRSSLEYADVIWDNLSIADKDKLEKVQLQALRIITGLTISTPKEYIYIESGIDPLETRRQQHRLIQFYKIINGSSPDTLQQLLPPRTHERSRYNTRNQSDFTIYKCNTELYKSSFFPKTVSEWNKLPTPVKESESVAIFKTRIKSNINKPPAWYYYGKRKLNILLCQLRNECSPLNDDLFQNHIRTESHCTCGAATENAEHFLLYCPLYNNHRETLFTELLQEISIFQINSKMLLFGDHQLPAMCNCNIVKHVCNFIANTQRFN
jgi:hypothetical protein